MIFDDTTARHHEDGMQSSLMGNSSAQDQSMASGNSTRRRTIAIRKSIEYMPLNPQKTQNVWPAAPDFENPVVLILHNDAYGFLNFGLQSGDQTELATDGVVIDSTYIDPDTVGKAILCWKPNNGQLFGFQLFDRQNTMLMSAGFVDENLPKHEVSLAEDERICGVASAPQGQYASHFDFQFIVAKGSSQ